MIAYIHSLTHPLTRAFLAPRTKVIPLSPMEKVLTVPKYDAASNLGESKTYSAAYIDCDPDADQKADVTATAPPNYLQSSDGSGSTNSYEAAASFDDGMVT